MANQVSHHANGLTDQEIRELVKSGSAPKAATTPAATNRKVKESATMPTQTTIDPETVSRNLLVIGCGDGGCNIASAIRDRISDVSVIAFNTSSRGMDNIHADVKLIPAEEDGSGKFRDYSQDVFKSGAYNKLFTHVQKYVAETKNLQYIIVTTTCDGGTGSGVSPMVARFISDNFDTPVIIVGVYPSLNEDSFSQLNALKWQADVEKFALPYMIFDNNNYTGSKTYVHNMVNAEIADAMEVITGYCYGDTNIQAIDNRDVWMILQNIGGRIAVFTDDHKPKVNQSLDNYLINEVINKSSEPAPANVKAMGIFVKGDSSLIANTDTSLLDVRAKYGNAQLVYTHLEESSETRISLIVSGCSVPSERLVLMRKRYDEITASDAKNGLTANDLVEDLDAPVVRKSSKNTSNGPDLSALNM